MFNNSTKHQAFKLHNFTYISIASQQKLRIYSSDDFNLIQKIQVNQTDFIYDIAVSSGSIAIFANNHIQIYWPILTRGVYIRWEKKTNYLIDNTLEQIAISRNGKYIFGPSEQKLTIWQVQQSFMEEAELSLLNELAHVKHSQFENLEEMKISQNTRFLIIKSKLSPKDLLIWDTNQMMGLGEQKSIKSENEEEEPFKRISMKEEVYQYLFKDTNVEVVSGKLTDPVVLAVMDKTQTYYLWQECSFGESTEFRLMERVKLQPLGPGHQMSMSWFHYIEEDKLLHIPEFQDDQIERKTLVSTRKQQLLKFKLAEYLAVLRGPSNLIIYKLIHSQGTSGQIQQICFHQQKVIKNFFVNLM